jgi:hypothetical protein
LVRIEPQAETVKVTEGEVLAFVAEASGATPLRYEWILQEQEVSREPRWSYHPTAGEGGGEPKKARLRVTDQDGQLIEKHWQVTVARANQPPRLLAATPTKDTVELLSGTTQTFSVEAQDPESEPLAYEWTVDGETAGTQATLHWKAQGEGRHRVRAVVRDRGGLMATQEWQVAVLAPPPVPASVPSAHVSSPRNAPPRIALRLPSERILAVREGESIDFSAMALDPDGDELIYSWSVDGKKTAQGERFSFTASNVGKRRIDLEVIDRTGLKDSARWEVKVEAPPPAPRLVMFTPQQPQLSLYPHQSRFFAVEVEVPGTVEPTLRYEWKVDGRPVAGRELFEFKNQLPGTHEVAVTTTDPSGAAITHTWTVAVRQEPETRPSAWAPRLEIFDLESAVSANKEQVTVRGKVRNIDERDADNVVVWVTALNPQRQTLLRRLVLPMPQPLAPGQVTTFQVALRNHEAVTDFHVEVVSK